MIIHPRGSVVFAEDFPAMVEWYQNVLGLKVTSQVEDEYHYCNLENEARIRIGISDVTELGVSPGDRRNNTVVHQVQVTDVQFF